MVLIHLHSLLVTDRVPILLNKQGYGGTLPEGPGDLHRYFAQGYWEKQTVAAAAATVAVHRSSNVPPPPPPPPSPLSSSSPPPLSPPPRSSFRVPSTSHKHTYLVTSHYKGSGATV